MWNWWRNWWLPASLLTFVVMTWLIFLPLSCFTERFAALSALFSGLAFAALFWNIFRQGQELKVEKVKERFFHLMSAWQNIALNTDFGGGQNIRQGNQAFFELWGKLKMEIDKTRGTQNSRILTKQEVIETFKRFYNYHSAVKLGHVFRTFYELVKRVDENRDLDYHEKQRLISVFRALLSDAELYLLLYLGLSDIAEEDLFQLIEKYDLLYGLALKSRENFDTTPEIKFYPETYRRWRKRRGSQKS